MEYRKPNDWTTDWSIGQKIVFWLGIGVLLFLMTAISQPDRNLLSPFVVMVMLPSLSLVFLFLFFITTEHGTPEVRAKRKERRRIERKKKKDFFIPKKGSLSSFVVK